MSRLAQYIRIAADSIEHLRVIKEYRCNSCLSGVPVALQKGRSLHTKQWLAAQARSAVASGCRLEGLATC